MEYFGVNLREKEKGFKLNRETFALVDTKPSLPFFSSLVEFNAYDETGSSYKIEWCKKYRELCLKNYDLNMKYFSLLDEKEFNKALKLFLKRYPKFESVTNLAKYDGVEGYYILVLDEYKQVYIGKSNNVKKEIIQHWARKKAFDRTLVPMYAYDKSCFSIDFFGALDTKRIFIWSRKNVNGVEAELIQNFPAQFCTNRIGGDITNGIKAIITNNKRKL